ncbi:MAG: hypothetical protein HFG44_00265 [Oscillospiraceae bacterium]|jgi:stage III sporulation protein AB|nr:hypothetical protein [Oscillospiraceae bacterium]
MMIRLLGVFCILGACGYCGFSFAASVRQQELALRELQMVLELMQCEIRYRITPLPALCASLAQNAPGVVGQAMGRLGKLLEQENPGEISDCMNRALNDSVPKDCAEVMRTLSYSLGKFDLEGQLQGLEAAKADCQRRLQNMEQGKESRLRSYRALGLCGGAALAILLL